MRLRCSIVRSSIRNGPIGGGGGLCRTRIGSFWHAKDRNSLANLLVVVAALPWRVTLDLEHSKEKLRRLLQRHILDVGDENAVDLIRE